MLSLEVDAFKVYPRKDGDNSIRLLSPLTTICVSSAFLSLNLTFIPQPKDGDLQVHLTFQHVSKSSDFEWNSILDWIALLPSFSGKGLL